MKITVVGKDYRVSDSMRDAAERKLGKFNRYFDDTAEAQLKFTPEGDQIRAEITIRAKRHIFRSEVITDSDSEALDLAIDNLKRQLRKHKTKLSKRIHDYAYLQESLKSMPPADPSVDEELLSEGKLIKRKSFEISPMNEEEACMQMDLQGHNFHLFLSEDGNKVCLVYKRRDGNYGLIEPMY